MKRKSLSALGRKCLKAALTKKPKSLIDLGFLISANCNRMFVYTAGCAVRTKQAPNYAPVRTAHPT